MRAINRKNARHAGFLPVAMKPMRRVWNASRRVFLLSSFLVLVVPLACSFGCAPSSSPTDGAESGSSASSASSDLPEITEEMIRERINNARVRQVPEENGAGAPISWSFVEDEPKEIRVVEKQIAGERATIVLEIKTGSSPNAREPRQLAGQIRTEWELQTGWALRRWEIVKTENVSFKYKNLSKPPAQNSNR